MITIRHLGRWVSTDGGHGSYHVMHVDDPDVPLLSGSISVYYEPTTLVPRRLFRDGKSCIPRKGTAQRQLLDDLVPTIIVAAKLTEERQHEHLTFKGIFTD